MIVIPDFFGLYGLIFLILAIILPIMYSWKEDVRDYNLIFTSLEVIALLVDFYILYAIAAYLLSVLEVFDPLLALIISLVVEIPFFRYYRLKLWSPKDKSKEKFRAMQ